MTIEVIKPGLLTSFQDTGRPGYSHLGVGRSGAFDTPALRIANMLCGNPVNACGLEITLLGPTLRFRAEAWIAVAGAPIPVRVDGSEAPTLAPLRVPAGATVALGAMHSGCRSYLAVRGGFHIEPVLGSRSTDVNAGLGPFDGRPLQADDVLEMGSGSFFEDTRHARHDAGKNEPDPISSAARATPNWWLDPRPWFGGGAREPLRLLPGSHLDSLTTASRTLLFSEPFKVHADSNRVGLRLSGPKLEFDVPIEMTSEGCVAGLLQLPPSGQPIVFGPEGPVSGGYPRLGQIAAVDLPRLAQCRPGDALRFAPCTFDAALAALDERKRALTRLEATIAARLSA